MQLIAQEKNFTPKKTNDGWPVSDEYNEIPKLVTMDSLIHAEEFKLITSISALELVVLITSTNYRGGMQSHLQTTNILDNFAAPVFKHEFKEKTF